MYSIEFGRRARKELKGLERGDQLRVLKKLDDAANDPARFFMALKGVEGFRMRVGDLRVVADVDAENEIILVATIGKRDSMYR